MPATDHNSIEYTIHRLVYNRIAFLVSGTSSDELISNFIVETAYEAQPCFNVAGNVGEEASYNKFQKSILADMVSVGILKRIVAQNSQSVSVAGATNNFLKKAKAGSAEAEFEQIEVDKTIAKDALVIKAQNLIQLYVEDIVRKYGSLGCSYFGEAPNDAVGFIVNTYE